MSITNIDNEAISIQIEANESFQVPQGEVWRVHISHPAGWGDTEAVEINGNTVRLNRGGGSSNEGHRQEPQNTGDILLVGGDEVEYKSQNREGRESITTGAVWSASISGFVVKNDD